MGRRSKLSPEQWADIEKRMLAGVPVRALARQFSVSETAIRHAKSSHVEKVRMAATLTAKAQQATAAAEEALSVLPISSQIAAYDHAATLRRVKNSMGQAAVLSADTSDRLAKMASGLIRNVDTKDPGASVEAVKSAAVLQRLANDASQIPVAMLALNREEIPSEPRSPDMEFWNDPTITDAQAAAAYLRIVQGLPER